MGGGGGGGRLNFLGLSGFHRLNFVYRTYRTYGAISKSWYVYLLQIATSNVIENENLYGREILFTICTCVKFALLL